MKIQAALVCMLVLVWPMAIGAQRQSAKSDQEILVELERGWNAAFYRKDLAHIGNLLADEFIATYEDGTQGDKAKELSMVSAFDQQVDSATQSDFVVKVYGDTAIVWFTLNLVGPSQGRALAIALRYVDVFVWRADRWQCVSSHSTKVTGK
jgi:ketosteroid isomerase-like protein